MELHALTDGDVRGEGVESQQAEHVTSSQAAARVKSVVEAVWIWKNRRLLPSVNRLRSVPRVFTTSATRLPTNIFNSAGGFADYPKSAKFNPLRCSIRRLRFGNENGILFEPKSDVNAVFDLEKKVIAANGDGSGLERRIELQAYLVDTKTKEPLGYFAWGVSFAISFNKNGDFNVQTKPIDPDWHPGSDPKVWGK